MVEVTEDYRFQGPGGEATLLDLFEGRRQLILDHYMFDPGWDEGCTSCAARVDQYGKIEYLHRRETTIAVVSRAPLEKLERFKAEMGWTFPWYSSFGSRFNFDYGVSFEPGDEGAVYNYRGLPAPEGELPGTSVFLRDGERVFHTYSTYARGMEQVGGTGYYLDMTPLGRQEEWERSVGEGHSTASDRG